jgi:hypothetical protein
VRLLFGSGINQLELYNINATQEKERTYCLVYYLPFCDVVDFARRCPDSYRPSSLIAKKKICAGN